MTVEAPVTGCVTSRWPAALHRNGVTPVTGAVTGADLRKRGATLRAGARAETARTRVRRGSCAAARYGVTAVTRRGSGGVE